MQRPVERVEDYTGTCLVMFLVNLLWVFFVLWAAVGWGAVLVVALVLNRMIARIGQRRRARG